MLPGVEGDRGSSLCCFEPLLCFGGFLLAMPCSLQDLSSLPGIKLTPPAVEVRSPNYWTTREFPESLLKRKRKCTCITFNNKKKFRGKSNLQDHHSYSKSFLIP